MTEKNTIQELERQSRNARLYVDRINKAHYDSDMGQMLETVQNLAKIVIMFLEKYEGK
mgnify:CR=1 FL=1